MKQVEVKLVVVLLGLTVCAAVAQEIKIGDSREKVIAQMGPFKNRMAFGGQEIIVYEQVEVTLKNGFVDQVQRRARQDVAAQRVEKPTPEQPQAGNPKPHAIQKNRTREMPHVTGTELDRATLLADNAKWYETTKEKLQSTIDEERDLLDKYLAARKTQLETEIAKLEKGLGDLDKSVKNTTALVLRDKKTGHEEVVGGGTSAEQQYRRIARGFQVRDEKSRDDAKNEPGGRPCGLPQTARGITGFGGGGAALLRNRNVSGGRRHGGGTPS